MALACAVLALALSAAPLALAQDPPGGTTPTAPPNPFPPGPGVTILVDTDNEDNAGSGNPDGDMGGPNPPCVFDASAIHPIEWNFNVAAAPTNDAELFVQAFDVDETAGEIDDVYFNGTLVGTLTGENNQFSNTVMSVPIGLVTAGNNLVQVFVTVSGWCVAIPRAQLVLDGGAPATASCASISTDLTQYDPGDTVTVEVDVDTSLMTQDVNIEVALLDFNDVNVAGTTDSFTVTGAQVDPRQYMLALPGNAATGQYRAEVLIFDANTQIFQDGCEAAFGVGEAVPTMPAAMWAVLLAVLLALGLGALRRRRPAG